LDLPSERGLYNFEEKMMPARDIRPLPIPVMPLWQTLVVAAGFVSCTALPTPVHSAQPSAFPNKPIRILAGFSVGSTVDLSARVVAEKLVENLKQQVIVDNRSGAGGVIAAQTAAKANPDGYTLLSVSAAHAVAPSIYTKLPYDTLKDFAGISTTVKSPAVLVAYPGLGAKSVKDLIAIAKAKPGTLNFASAGIGSATHFSAELFKSMAGIDVVHVPFKGISEGLTETMTGRVQYFLSPLTIAHPMIKDGRVTALGVTSAKRSDVLPEVPTIAESGLPNYVWETWFGLLAPAKTPRPIIDRLNREITRALDLPDVRKRWTTIGAVSAPSTPQQFDKLIAEQIKVFTKLARAAGVKAD
jgi:tripartite-type tricarboxylate transporter receptor subunit TctC